MKVIIVGAHGEAKELINRISSGWSISVIDLDQDKLRNFSTNRQIEKIQGDATSSLVLKKAGLDPLSVNLQLDNNSTTKIDDVLDSMVLFITALRIYEGNYLCLEKTKIENNDDNGKIFI